VPQANPAMTYKARKLATALVLLGLVFLVGSAVTAVLRVMQLSGGPTLDLNS
jgi:hypothetical protein